MKSKMRKKLIAFMLCMVLVICNSVSILADAPAAATTTTEKQVKETGTAKSEGASEEEKAADDEKDTSEQSDEESAPETETTEKKEETTEATTEDKEDATTEATTKAKEETTEATETSDKDQTTGAEDDSDKKDKTSESSEEETDKEKTTEAKDETAPSELTYTNDDVVITVSEMAEGAIPEGAELKVVPILKDDADTQTQYAEVEQKIQEKAAETETEIKGFLAYDITFVDEEGNEIEPNSEVKVSIEYKQAAIPAEISEEDAKDTEVSVMHLEEDADGNVSQVVDMGEASQLKQIETTENNAVNKAEFIAESFSVYTLTWKADRAWDKEIEIHYIDSEGNEIAGKEDGIFDNVFEKDKWINLSTEEIQVNIPGYTYSRTVISSSKSNALNQKNTNIKYVRVSREYGGWTVRYRLGDNGGGQAWNSYSDPIICIIYDKNTTVDPDPGTPEEPELEPLGTPEHNKYVDYNETNDDYRLTLDVEGEVGEPLPIDILLIVDSSGSMYVDEYDNWGNPIKTNNKWKYVNQAISSLKNTLLQEKKENSELSDVEINLGVATFSAKGSGTDTVRDNADDFSWKDTVKDSSNAGWHELESFNWSLRTSDCDGGTNWQAGIQEGEDLLSQKANTDTYSSRKYVIFLTDGEPTYRYYYQNGNYYTQGTGDDDPGNKNYYAAVSEWNESSTLKSSNGRYVIDVTSGNKKSAKCESFAGAMGGRCIKANDEQTMKDTFKNIAEEIAKPVYKNVSITDSLSTYAELTDTPNFTVNAVNTETNQSVSLSSADYTITVYDAEGGRIYEGSNPNVAEDVDWTQGRKVELALNLPNYEDSTQSGVLGDNIKYSISFNIKATGTAKEEYATKKQYPNTGDPETDAAGNHTSSGQQGFYSNDDKNTFLTYQENNNDAENVSYPNPVIQVKDNLEPVNFYLNLSSQIMDSSGNIASRDKGNFTTCVSGPQSALHSDHGIGVAINEHLFVELPENHAHPSSGEMGVIGSKDNQNAVVVDGNIRSLKEGTVGTEAGHTTLKYKIIDTTTGQGAFPEDDGEIFEYIRNNWGSETSVEEQNAKNVNKGKNITVNGVAIDKENLTTNNFLIRWYVFKDNAGDFWHIDGVLVPKSGILNVTKTFPNETIAESVQDTFSINVEGNFLVGNNINSTITKTLAEATKKNNEDGSVTYTWTLAIFGEQYTVSESGYTTNSGQWIYSSTDCKYTDVNGDSPELKINNNDGVISTTITTDCDWVDQVEQASQTLAFTNNYTLKTVDLDLVKTSKNSDTPIDGAIFKLSKKNGNNWIEVQGNISVSDEADQPELSGLVTDTIYKLDEIQAPEAHMLLGESIYFTVEDDKVLLCDENGTINAGTNEMWELSSDGTVLTVKNNILYSLPSAGGPGIYWYTLSGTLLMAGAALIVYRQKRKREVLLRK